MTTAPDTPMMKQYQEIKARVPDALLFFRLGDFYEMFGDDAHLGSRLLELTLTGRGVNENRVPMCGIPYHAADGYIEKLISKGYKVAICEQVEDPRQAKGIVRRDIVRLITPGTVIEPEMLPAKRNQYLAALSLNGKSAGIAVADSSTGEFRLMGFEGGDNLPKILDALTAIAPSEILVSQDTPVEQRVALETLGVPLTNYRYRDIDDPENAGDKLKAAFQLVSLDPIGAREKGNELCAASAIVTYLQENLKTPLSHLKLPRFIAPAEFLRLDGSLIRNLELFEPLRSTQKNHCVLAVIDQTVTAAGGRRLASWLNFPLRDMKAINNRLDAVEELLQAPGKRRELALRLTDTADIERLCGKLSARTANARDLTALSETILCLPGIAAVLEGCQSSLLQQIQKAPQLTELSARIQAALVPDPPIALTEGGLIRDGYNADLDAMKAGAREAKTWIASLEEREKLRTGIKSLKVGYTKVFGYFIEISTSNVKHAPADYIRKQTLVNGERFVTPELKEKETLVLGTDEKTNLLEYELFAALRDHVTRYIPQLQELAALISECDALLSLAAVAAENGYSRPVLGGDKLEIVGGRHPVVEKVLGAHRFVPNDIAMGEGGGNFLIITGPNMAGKSTYMRQTALIAILAHCGSYVPATSARIPLLDQIFARIGAGDDLASGQSTFMVEMLEVSKILNSATKDSLIILDEVGRGTATFDGMSIARAVAEYIQGHIKARTLFATHYHELTQLADDFRDVRNVSCQVIEDGHDIRFLHRIADGPASKSYGIQVARLAGLPPEIIERAHQIHDGINTQKGALNLT